VPTDEVGATRTCANHEEKCNDGLLSSDDNEDMDSDDVSLVQLRKVKAHSEASVGKMARALVGRLEEDARRVIEEKLERFGHKGGEIMKDVTEKIHKMTLSEIEFAAQSGRRTMEPVCVGLKAAAAAYRFGNHGAAMGGEAAKADLEADGYSFVRGYNKSTTNDWDYMGLWNKGGDCIITFQGSSDDADFASNWDHTPVEFMGLTGVHQGLTTELGGLLAEVNWATVKQRCTGNLMVAGHSLGGGLTQLFAGVINAAADPLGADLHVDQIFTFGAMPVSQDALSSGSDSDGCFGGSAFYTARHNADGTDAVDIVANKNVGGTDQTFDPVRTMKVLLFGAGDSDRTEFECGNQLPLSTLGDSGFDLHAIQLYEYYAGCMTTMEFYALMAAFQASTGGH